VPTFWSNVLPFFSVKVNFEVTGRVQRRWDTQIGKRRAGALSELIGMKNRNYEAWNGNCEGPK
jgi:hypothetical protein